MILKPEPLKGQKKFKNLYQKGIKLERENFLIYYAPLFDFPLKFSVVVNSKYGKAVKRNKLKRQVRAFLNREGFNFLPFFGNLLIYFKKEFNLDYNSMKNSLINSFLELKKCLKNLQ